MENQTLPTLYRSAVPLNSEIHAELTIGPSPQGFIFAASAQSVLLAGVEFFDAGRHYPIVFSATPDGRVLPQALLGLEAGENLFVDAAGAWTASYILAYIRRYPFITTDEVEGRLTVCFDEQFDGFNREGGQPLFADGQPTARMQEIQALLQDYLQQLSQTEQLGATLAQAGLLRQIDLNANLADGRSLTVNGLLVVDEQKLSQLPDLQIVQLFRSGMLAQITAHLLSLRNIDRLIELKSRRSQQTG